MKVSVIIVSAGKSTRMGGVNKQFLVVGKLPVLIRSILAFDALDEVFEIIIVTNSDNFSAVSDLTSKYNFNKNIILTIGGESRQQSVFNGFEKVSVSCDFVAIHDGARPLVTSQSIKNAFENAEKYGASTLGVPVKDTIKTVQDGFICNTLDRNSLFITQTPQVFETKLYQKGFENALEKGLDFTDDCQLIEAIGTKVFMTNGDYSNIKITTPDDVKLANMFLMEG